MVKPYGNKTELNNDLECIFGSPSLPKWPPFFPSGLRRAPVVPRTIQTWTSTAWVSKLPFMLFLMDLDNTGWLETGLQPK